LRSSNKRISIYPLGARELLLLFPLIIKRRHR
jgi:hypothetical protein